MEKSVATAGHRRLAAILRALREEAELKQIDLAARLGETQSAISKVENGQRRLDLVQLTTYCQAIGCELRDVIERWEADLGVGPSKTKRSRRPR